MYVCIHIYIHIYCVLYVCMCVIYLQVDVSLCVGCRDVTWRVFGPCSIAADTQFMSCLARFLTSYTPSLVSGYESLLSPTVVIQACRGQGWGFCMSRACTARVHTNMAFWSPCVDFIICVSAMRA